jgi:hypothetical protein
MHLRNRLFLLGLLFAFFAKAQEQVLAKKTYTTSQTKEEIIIDGFLDDSSWDQVEWGGDFVGHRPEFNVKPSQETQFKILYDDKFLYVGIRAFDTEPEKIVERMSRRDGFDGDWVEINIDSYNDKRTAFSFTASVSGVKGDEYISNNGDFDSTWDPIWYLKTSIDELGWIAEFKIPLSQLRFADRENHVWGMQLTRRFFRNEERSTWQTADPNAPGWVHLFGELNGIKGIKSQKQLEIQPYVLAAYKKFPKEADNPFRNSGKELDGNIGLDAKIGLTSDITLDLTFNPDFGQVEADPSAVNLSAFRLFFREQRPFFLEGSSLLSFGTSGGPNNLFYSRRIGGRPSVSPSTGEGEYADAPKRTSIIGAAKLTGKNAKGFSWAFLESVTNKESAVIDSLGKRREEIIEPYTNYSVARVQQDFNDGKTVIGALVTNTNRFNNRGNGLEYIHDNAQSGGIDINHNISDRKYGVNFKYMFSRVEGTEEAIRRTQEASERFFQRPDNNYRDVDTTRTTLTGTAAMISFGKRSGNLRWTIGSNYKSPELELNDIGFLRQTDNINNWAFIRYNVNQPKGILRSQNYNAYVEHNMDFGGVANNKGGNLEMNLDFTNLWNFGQGLWIGGRQVSNADLRGGPSIAYPGNINYWYYFDTNSQKKIRFSFNNWFNWGNQNYSESMGMSVSLSIRPTDALRITLSPNLNKSRNNLQYVDDVIDENTDLVKYILSTVNSEQFATSLRVNYNITPNLTLEFWGQPFFFFADYSDYKLVTNPDHSEFKSRYYEFSEDQISYNESSNVFDIDENVDGTIDYGFNKPDFKSFQWQSNMVLRWEYIPGSTLFAVWSSNGNTSDVMRYSDSNTLLYSADNINTSHTFLIKYTYRFIL